MTAKKVPNPTGGTPRTSREDVERMGKTCVTGSHVPVKDVKKDQKHTIVEKKRKRTIKKRK